MSKQIKAPCPLNKTFCDTVKVRIAEKGKSVGQPAAARYPDGHNLFLYVSKTGAKSWVFVWSKNGIQREIGLGSYTGDGITYPVDIAKARAKAQEVRNQIAAGLDPLAERNRAKLTDMTFGDVCTLLLDSRATTQKGDKTRKSWEAMLSKNYGQKLWVRRIADITSNDVTAVLKPVWHEYKAEQLQERIAAVFDYAHVADILPEAHKNPAILTKMVAMLGERVPPEVKNHAALSSSELPGVIKQWQAMDSMDAKACLLTTLTAVRSSVTLMARWDEITDLGDGTGLWTLSKDRMKTNKDHIVPLSRQAMAVIKSIAPLPGNPCVFWNERSKDGHLVKGSMDDLLCDKMGYRGKATMHGMRSAFETWAGGIGFNQKAIDMVMAHADKGKKDKVKAAYDRNDMLEYRTEMLQGWADFACGARIDAKNVISLAERRQAALALEVAA